jgi:divalent metal cation (Fe/Co/Zn/Cd) transporter
MTNAATATRRQQLGRAQRLAAFTVAYNLIEGAIAVTAGLAVSSQALTGFGLDSGVESISAAVLLWRLRAERQDPQRAARVEHVAARAIGVSFLLLAAWVAFESIGALVGRDEPDASTVGLVLTGLSLVVMPILARRKRHAAAALGSRAAAADAAQTRACVWLSAVVLAGLALNAALGWWWADPVAALGVVVLLLTEAREALIDNDDD